MITDKDLLVSTDQAITASAGSTDYIDLSVARDVGAGEPLELFARVTEDFAAADGKTLTSVAVSVQADDAADFSGASALYSGAAIATASLKAGYYFALPPLPPGTSKRYLRLYYTMVGDAGAGKITAGVVLDKPANVKVIA